MAQWNLWEPSFMNVTLLNDGDDVEMEGATKYKLDTRFPNYEYFWKRHVVPATNRPANCDHRKFIDPVFTEVTEVSHGVYYDLVKAERALVLVKHGVYGDSRCSNCQEALLHGGNAMQKYDDLQRRCMKVRLSARLGKPLIVWNRAQFTAQWKARYDKLSAYRNFLTHTNTPQIIFVPQAYGTTMPHVPHEDHFLRYKPLTWPEQEARFQTHQSEWDALWQVCERVQDQTIAYLNDAYAEVIKILDPLVTDEDYQDLWGWDTNTHGLHAQRRATGGPANSPPQSGAGFAQGPNRQTGQGGSGLGYSCCS
jgi:hypothetical protein